MVLLGPPGAGKGTLAGSLSEYMGLPVFVTGDVLREEIARGTELGKKVRARVEEGGLVDDETILQLARRFLERHPEGVIFDGFPRTLTQARGLCKIISEDDELQVIYLDASQETILRRLTARRVCPDCGRIYNLRFRPPAADELCDVCGKPLIQRSDDTEEVIKQRYQVYVEETEPLVEFFGEMVLRVDGDQEGDEVLKQVKAELCPA